MGFYEITVQNHIDKKRLRDFNGLDIQHMQNGNTLLSGSLKDQSELFYILNKIRDMNLTLVSLKKDEKEMEELI